MVLSILIAGAFAIVMVAALLQLVSGHARLGQLADHAPVSGAAPRVSIVVPALNEERHVESAVRSLLRLEYPDYELVVVNDRSTDRTGEILHTVAATEPRLQVVHVTELPAGWLGKNHALQLGADRATGELLLFADADVIFEPRALSRAVGLAQRERADHVTVVPELILPSIWLALFVDYLFMWGFLALRPWKTADPRSGAFSGVGAFNLVRVSAYRAVGGHRRIAMRPDDDLMLGKLLKRSGFRQIAIMGHDQLSIEWYRTLREAIRAFRKNTFAVLNYNTAIGVGVVSLNIAGAIPFVAPFFTTGVTRALYGAAAAASVLAFVVHARANRSRPWLAPLYPVAALLSAAVIGSIVARTLWSRSIDWRGTSYSLDELRANRV